MMNVARIVKVILTLAFLPILSTYVLADIHTATSCSQADVQVAIGSASPGDTVEIPAGTATWVPTASCFQGKQAALCMVRGLKLQGGIGGTTTITITGYFMYGAVQYSPDATARANNEKFELAGFTFNGNNEDHGYGLVSVIQYSKTEILSNVLIHNNIFRDEGHSITINGPVSGVAWSNTFDRVGNVIKVEGFDDNSWNLVSNNYGENAAFFFEDNTIKFSAAIAGDSGGATSGQGGSLVYRYNMHNYANSSTQSFWDVHGLQSMTNAPGVCNGQCPVGGTCYSESCCQQWATVKAEYYGNIMSNIGSTAYQWILHRGRQLLMFNNVMSGGSNPAVQYTQYSCDSCQSPAFPAYSQHVQNTYIWNNTTNETNRNMIKRYDYCADNVFPSPYAITENRDFWNYNSACTSSSCPSGIGCGSSAPTGTCTTGVGFWVTSESSCSSPPSTMADMKKSTQAGMLYQCTAAHAWKPYYKPFAYPHPLRGEGATEILALSPGWNWISFNIQPAGKSLDWLYFGVLDKIEQVKSQTQSIIRSNSAWKGDLTSMDGIGQYTMYKVKVTQACTLAVSGTAIDPTTPIPLHAGWNWVAYLPTTSMSISPALDSIKGQVLQVKSRTASAIYSGGAWSGSLSKLDPGQGYEIKMSSPGTLIY